MNRQLIRNTAKVGIIGLVCLIYLGGSTASAQANHHYGAGAQIRLNSGIGITFGGGRVGVNFGGGYYPYQNYGNNRYPYYNQRPYYPQHNYGPRYYPSPYRPTPYIPSPYIPSPYHQPRYQVPNYRPQPQIYVQPYFAPVYPASQYPTPYDTVPRYQVPTSQPEQPQYYAPRPYKSAIENDVPVGQGSIPVQGQEQEQLRQELERHQSEIKRILTGR